MTLLHNPLLENIAKTILEALGSEFPDHGQTLEQIYQSLGEPPNLDLGHVAYPCFPLAKVCRQAPPKIAAALQGAIKPNPVIKEVTPQGPYLNFFLTTPALGKEVVEDILSGNFFARELTSHKPKTMIEYCQPNTHKVLHVGHMRNLCLGNAVVNLNRYLGREVFGVTYPGDVGTHVAKCLWYLKHHNTEPMPTENKGAWLGQIYAKGNEKLEDEKGTPKEDENRAQLTQILKELEAGSGDYYDTWKETREWSLDLMNEAYDWADVKFDRWFFESEVDAPSIKLVKDYYEKGILVKDDGAIGMDLSEDKLGFCLLIKSDGTGLYATKDVELARRKFEEFGIERNIYVVDNRQAYHFKQVFKVLEKIGFEQSKDCYHLEYEMVELPDGAMSSRKGNIVPLMDLVSGMQETIKTEYLSRYESEWSKEEIEETAKMVANGAIKYGMIRVDNNRKIIFDMAEWLKLDGETGPYLQYVHARIHSLVEKLTPEAKGNINWSLLDSSQEERLMLKLTRFNEVVLQAADQLKTIHLCAYLYELGKLFNSFYAECPIGKAENEELKATRLALAKSVGLVMKQGLELLGIPAPEKM